MRKEKLIDIIIANRTEKALDRLLEHNKEYREALKEQDEAFSKLDQIKESEVRKTVSKALDANNNCGAVYGKEAYRLGLQDGLRLAVELRALCRRK